ncbi:MAG: tetratricopeptide repeat protein [Bacteroidales bacterium]|nr:tetratricopeptide repeat protein [Bacteroidales bacterium]
MKKVLFIICIPLLLAISGFSQNIVDSLITVLEKDKPEGKERIDLLLKICLQTCNKYQQYRDQGMEYAMEVINTSKRIDDDYRLASGYHYLGRMYTAVDYDSAFFYLVRSRELYEEQGQIYNATLANTSLATLYLSYGHYDTALILYKSTFETFEQEPEYNKLMFSLNGVGRALMFLGNYSEALKYFKQSYAIIEREDVISRGIPELSNIAWVYYTIGSYDKVLEYLNMSLRICEAEKDSFILGKLYGNAAIVYQMQKDNENALEYHIKSLIISKRMNDHLSIPNTYMNIGDLYCDMKQYSEAEKYAIQSIELARELGNKGSIVHGLKLLSKIHYSREQYDKALKNSLEAQSIIDEIKLGNEQSGIKIEIGKIYLLKGEYLEALKYIQKGLNNAAAAGELKNICEADSLLSNIFELLGNTDSALFYRKLYSWHQDSLVNTEKETKIANLQIEYETEKKEQQIAILEKDNEVQELQIQQSRIFNWGLVGLVVVILLMALLFIRQNKLKNEHKTVVLEQKLLRLQMNPHFIFNVHSNILGFIENKKTESAARYLSTFSKLLRTTLESSRNDYIYLDEEINMIKAYLDLQKLLYENKFDYTLEVDDQLDPDDVSIPPMLIQPFIENAIKHGISQKTEKGNVFVRFKLEDKKVICEVEDDGVGREKAWEAEYKTRKEHKSLATSIILDRIKAINKKMKQKINLNIIDLRSDNNEPIGTMVVLNLPLS